MIKSLLPGIFLLLFTSASGQCIFAPTEVCLDDCGPVFYLVNHPAGTTYEWSISCGTITNPTQANPHTACFTSPGICTLQVIVQVPLEAPDTCVVYVDVIAPVYQEVLAMVCPGDSAQVNGRYYTEGMYTDTLHGASQAGCDSILLITVSTISMVADTFTYVGCMGDSFSVIINGINYNELNPFGFDTLHGENGCDTTILIELIFNPIYSQSISDTICSGSGYEIIVNGITYDENNPVGTEVFTAQNECDSIVMIELIYLPLSFGLESYMGCEGDGFMIEVNGTIYGESNPQGVETLTGSNGCDSIVTIDLVFHSSTLNTLFCYTGCQGDGYQIEIGGQIFDESNPYHVEVLVGSNGCDSIITIELMFINCMDTLEVSGNQLCAPASMGSYTWLDCFCNPLPDTTQCISVSGMGCACVIVMDSTGLDTICMHYEIEVPMVEIIQVADSLCASPDDLIFLWTACGDLTVLNDGLCFRPPTSGCYCATATTPEGAFIDSSCVNYILSSTANEKSADPGRFRADWSSGMIYFQHPNLNFIHVKIQLTDIQGRMIPYQSLTWVDNETIGIQIPLNEASWLFVTALTDRFRTTKGFFLPGD